MSEDSLEDLNKSGSNHSKNAVFKTALFIDIPIEARIKETAEGMDLLKLSSHENFQTPTATPKQSFNDFLSSDLMKRLEENSPLRSHKSIDNRRKFSDFNLVNCESESDLNVLNKQMSKTTQDSSDLNGRKIYEKERRMQQNYSNVIPHNQTQIGTRNFKLKTEIIPSIDDDYFLDHEGSRSYSNFTQAKEEPKSLFNNSFRNFQQTNNFFSPTYKDRVQKQVRGDSSPIYSYYDGTAECLSQTFFDEFKKSNNDQFISGNNFIKKGDSQMDEMKEKSKSNNLFEDMSKRKDLNKTKSRSSNNDKFQDFSEPSINFGHTTNSKNNSTNSSIQGKKTQNVNVNNSKMEEGDEYTIEMFGRKGWICEMCNNFNYETRVKCNRCAVNKIPKKIKSKQKTDDEDDAEKKKKKPFVERMGDWVCMKCKNLNFSFRVVCNRCQLPKPDNEKMYENYMGNLINYVKANDMMQQRVMNMPYPPYASNGNLGYVNNNSISINNNYYSPFPQSKVPGHYGSSSIGNMGSNFYNSGMGMGNMGNMGMNSYMGGLPYGMENMQERGYYNEQP